jgi:hypothetical protein
MGRFGCIAISLVLMVASVVRAQPVIVEKGESPWAIYSPADASPAEKLAAEEVVRYIHEISGVQLPIVHDRERDNLLIVAAEANVGLRVPGNFVRLDEPDDYNVVAAANGVWICGKTGSSTLNAAYAFLDALGCRFLAPQYDHYRGSAEIVPKAPSITFTAGAIAARPALRYRKLYVEEGHSDDEANLRQMIEWMPKVGYNVLVVPMDYQGRGRVRWDTWREALTPELQQRGIIIEVGGHGYQNFLNAEMEDATLFQKHPEFFGADRQGRRRPEHRHAFCSSNPGAVDYLANNVIEYVQARPEIQIFDLWPPDGVRWCQCEACAELGTPSDRQALLLNELRPKLLAVRPDLTLEGIAYHDLKNPPQKVKLDPSVLIDFCPSRQNFEFTVHDPAAPTRAEGDGYPNGELAAKLKAWRQNFDGDISIYSYYRRYAWDSLPLVLPRFMQAELKFYTSVPVQGISTYCEPADWFAYELNHYVLANLAADPEQDIDALIGKFCDARYGPTAKQAAATLEVMAQVVPTYCSVPYVALKPKDQIEAAHAKLSAAEEELRAAKPSADEMQQRNIERLLLSIQYALGDLAIQAQRAGGADEATLRRESAKLHVFVSQHKDEGVFLVKNNRLSLPRMQARYGLAQPENRAADRGQRNAAAAPEAEAPLD